MNAFFQGALQDLREKRLLPVAILLLGGLAAVPVLLAKPAKDNASEPAAARSGAQSEAAKALVALADEDAGASSTLKLFNPRNPFASNGVKSLASLESSAIGQASTQLAGADKGSATASTDTGSSGGGGADTGSTGGSTTTGGGTTGGGTTGGGGNPGSGKPTTVKYTYVVDVTFTKDGHSRRVKGMKRLAMLPSESSPLLLFLGVGSGGDDAAFLVDSSLGASGEGHCSPSGSQCGVLTIGAGSVERFSDGDGHSYQLRIDEIRKVKIGKAAAGASLRAKSTDADKSGDRESTDRQVRRFTPPLLADLVTVASRQANDSSTDKASR